MSNSSLNVKKSLERLCELFGISLEYGWIKELADALQIDQKSLYNWLKRNKISNRGFSTIDGLGFPKEKWVVFENSDDESINPEDQKYLDMALQVFQSGDEGVCGLLKGAIRLTYDRVEQKRRFAVMEERLEELEGKNAAASSEGKKPKRGRAA